MLDPCTQTLVEIVNKRKATAKLCISQYILNEEGCYTRPKQSDIYYYTVRGFDYRQMITLDCENHWQCILDGLCPGCYEIKEHGCADEVGYKINGGEWCCHGRICLDEADVVQVGIYHHKKQIKHGCMRIQKWISTSEGELMQPDMTKRYEFIVESEQQMFTICLHAEMCIRDRDIDRSYDGNYQICAVCLKTVWHYGI